jgi:large subunit ribosomal protein L15
MSLKEFIQDSGTTKNRKRVGRGIGSGKGKTAGRGHKGQKSRTGVSINGFEGGQMPIYRRLPKRGFNNNFKKEFVLINFSHLEYLLTSKKISAKQLIDKKLLLSLNLIKSESENVKILAKGDLKTALNFKDVYSSKTAKEKIEKLGGKIEEIQKLDETKQ